MMISSIKFDRAVVGAIAATTILGCTAPQVFAQAVDVTIDGSSTVFPISEAMAEEFMAANRGVTVTVGVSGTGGGFEKFCNGELDITGASRPISESEVEACAANGIEYVQVPVASDAITVVINPANTWAENMTVEQLQMLWEPTAEGTITSWNQIDPSWPDAPISLFGPGTDSGTFDYFTDEIVGEEGASRADYTASEDDNILVLGVSRDENALGYFGYAYYVENQDTLKAVSIDGVMPSPETVESGEYVPLARPIFVYVKRSSLENNPQVRSFIEFTLANAPEIVPEVGYVPLAETTYTTAAESL